MESSSRPPELPKYWKPLNELLNRTGYELCRRCRRHKRIDYWCDCATAEEIEAAEQILHWRK